MFTVEREISVLPKIDPQVLHNPLRKLYYWHDVAKRTEIVYDSALKYPNQDLLEQLSQYVYCGASAGKMFRLVMPAEDIEEVKDLTLPHISKEEMLQETE
ncbi:hypothetical protein PIB30_043637 [Stylosanthes scabra]|uniref:Uncharacterized protein n=1 Tax=Stylosanthes scabra TaxID=79078 RepID=A0ABU6WDP0_9FABA|nr:hypothetical protein [Stylosanthes scabra]